MTSFQDFVNRELPRRSAHLTVELTGYDDDPNDSAAPAIITSSPKGTWYLRETPYNTWYRKNADGVWEFNLADQVTIYVDATSGDDANPGTSTSPVQTFKRASQLVANVRWGCIVNFAAGSYPVDVDNPSDFYEQGVLGNDPYPVNLQGAITTEETFNIDAVNSTGLQITKTGAGWIPGEHIGKFLDIGNSFFSLCIANNTVDTLEVIYSSNSIPGGTQAALTVSQEVSITRFDSTIIRGNEIWLNILSTAIIKFLKFDNLWLVSKFSNVTYLSCHFSNECRLLAGSNGQVGRAFVAYSYIEDGANGTGIETDVGRVSTQNCCFRDCDIAIDVWNGTAQISNVSAFYNCGKAFRIRDNSRILDYSVAHVYSNVGQAYFLLFDHAKVHKRDRINFIAPLGGGVELTTYLYYDSAFACSYLTNASTFTGNEPSGEWFRNNDATTFSWDDLINIYDNSFRDPNDNRVVKQTPTKYVQPYEAEFLDRVHQVYPPFTEDITILVETTGDDDADGINNPIASIYEAIRRIPASGANVVIQFGAGSFQLPDNAPVSGPTLKRTEFSAPEGGNLWVKGTHTVVLSFTIASSDGEYTVTKDGSTPDFVPGALVGELFDRGGGQFFQYRIVENTATTLTVITRTPNEMPSSGTYNVITDATKFTAPAGHGANQGNSVNLGSGKVTFGSGIEIDGGNILRFGYIISKRGDHTLYNPNVRNVSSNGSGILCFGRCSLSAGWFDTGRNGIANFGQYFLDNHSCFLNLTGAGVSLEASWHYVAYGATVYAKNVTTLYSLRYGAQLIQSKYHYLDTVTNFCVLADTDCKFDGHANDLLAVQHAGGGPLSTVNNYVFYVATQGQHDILLANSAGITLDSAVPSTWASINGINFSLSDFINVYNNNYIDSSLTRMNAVSGYTPDALSGIISQEPTGTTVTCDFTLAPNQTIDLQSATGDVTVTFNIGSPRGTEYLVNVIQGSVTRNIIWPGTVSWAGGTPPTITATNDAEDLFKFRTLDGTNFFGEIVGQNY